MINLDQITDKIRKILNGADSECAAISREGIGDFSFMVATEGVRFDSAVEKGKNRIPVFIGQIGGEFNPVEGLEEADYSISASVYFPLRFKEAFHKLEGYLAACLVGRFMTWGQQKARSNVSPAQYGEIEDIDLRQLKDWADTIYRQQIDTNEKWCSMTFNLFLSTAKGLGSSGGYIMGDQMEIEITYSGYTAKAEFSEASDKMTAEPESQQALGEKRVRNVAGATQYATSVTAYLKDDGFGRAIISDVMRKNCQGKTLTVKKKMSLSTAITDTSSYIVLDAALSYAKGQLMTVTLALGDF